MNIRQRICNIWRAFEDQPDPKGRTVLTDEDAAKLELLYRAKAAKLGTSVENLVAIDEEIAFEK